MFKTGSKLLFGLAVVGLVAAVAYAAGTGGVHVGMDAILGPLSAGYKGGVGEHAGYAVLAGLFVATLGTGIVLAALQDADPEAGAQAHGLDAVPEVPAPAKVNYWPVVGAFSIAALALGLAVGPPMFVIGLLGLFATTVEWAARAWSDRATGDPEVNSEIRNRLLQPIEIPVLAVVVIAIMVLAVSRILLALPKTGSYVVFGAVPALFLAVGALITLKPKLSRSVIAAMMVVGALAILAGGVVAAVHGPREHEGGHEAGHSESGAAPLPGSSSNVIRVGN